MLYSIISTGKRLFLSRAMTMSILIHWLIHMAPLTRWLVSGTLNGCESSIELLDTYKRRLCTLLNFSRSFLLSSLTPQVSSPTWKAREINTFQLCRETRLTFLTKASRARKTTLKEKGGRRLSSSRLAMAVGVISPLAPTELDAQAFRHLKPVQELLLAFR